MSDTAAIQTTETPKRKLRILLYTTAFYPKVDGVSLRVRHLLLNLKRLGYECVVMCPYEQAPAVFEGIPILKLPSFTPLNYSESKLAYPFPIITLLRVFTQFKPDFVHFVGPEFVFIPTVFICWLFGIPILGSYHWYLKAWLDNLPTISRNLLHWLLYLQRIYNLADYVITPSFPMKEILNAEGMKCNDVWPPAVDSNHFHPRHFNQALRDEMTFGNRNAVLVLYVGRVAIEKNLHLLPRLLDLNPNIHLAIVGNGPLAAEWRSRHGPQNRVFALGEHWLDEKLAQAYASADIFVLPSNFEALGNVVLEAMASRVAVVGCNAGGIPHMIKDRKTGLLFESQDQEGLMRAVNELAENPAFRQQMADAGRAYAETISWENSSKYVSEIYERVYKFSKEGKHVGLTDKFPEDSPKSSLMAPFLRMLIPLVLVAVLIQYFLGRI